MPSDDTKNKQFCGDVRLSLFFLFRFFLKSEFFRSAGNVIQEIKSRLNLTARVGNKSAATRSEI